MTVWAVASLRGSPGATTLVMGLGAAWPATTGRTRLVMEADPDGGVLAARFDVLRADRTIADAAVALRREFDLARLLETSRTVWGGLSVVPAHPSAEQTSSVLTNAGERMAVALASVSDLDAVVDVGRLTARSPALPLARRAVTTLVVSRTRFEDVASLSTRVRELRAAGVNPGLVAVGSRPYEPEAVASEAEIPLLAVLPHDAASAAVLSGEGAGDARLRRSLLWRTICELSSRLLQHASSPVIDRPSVAPPAARSGEGAAAVVRDPEEVPAQ
jgi:hypothetical protein